MAALVRSFRFRPRISIAARSISEIHRKDDANRSPFWQEHSLEAIERRNRFLGAAQPDPRVTLQPPENYTGVEVSTAEWKFVERLLPRLTVPQPPKHEQYPTASGWQPPSDPPPNVGYNVRRTRLHMLPVYFEVRSGQTRLLTTVRNIEGDIWELEEELRTFLKENHPEKFAINTQVNEMAQYVRFKGDFVEEVKQWLYKKGF